MALAATLASAFGSAFEAGCGSVLESVFETTFATVLDKPAAACDTSETGGNVDAACEGVAFLLDVTRWDAVRFSDGWLRNVRFDQVWLLRHEDLVRH